MNEDRMMKVIDENGNEKDMFILFTTKLDENNKSYVFYLDQTDPTGQVFVSAFDENSKLYPVETDDEWAKLEEIFNQFMEEENASSCQGNCEDCDDECNN